MNCDQLIPSNDVIDIIISRDEQGRVQEIPDCIQTLDGPYDLYYYKRERVPPLSIGNTAILPSQSVWAFWTPPLWR